MKEDFKNPSPLHNWEFERDACGVGFVANMSGERSYSVVDHAIQGLKNLAHRGAIDADSVTGDGAGILTQIPYELLRGYLDEQGKKLYDDSHLSVCMVFLPREDEYEQSHGRKIIEANAKKEGLNLLAWREVPVDPSHLGQKAERTRPYVLQGLFAKDQERLQSEPEHERACFLAMRCSTREAAKADIEDFYIVSFSCRTVTYKGLLNAPQVRRFYRDLKSPEFKSAFAIFHQRFATNTLPDWRKAQPYRMMAHNGEINTIRGNRNLMRAREFSPRHGKWGDRYKDLSPIIQTGMSDSASFDNALQLITVGGRSCIHACSMMIPPAWEKDTLMPEAVRQFYRYHSTVLEPWDGPAAVVFTDGRFIGASLDRNGLRPLRYTLYEDGTIVAASETGLVTGVESKVKSRGRLGPGRAIAVDIEQGKLLGDAEIKALLADQAEYTKWCEESLHNLHDMAGRANADTSKVAKDDLTSLQVANGYDLDERELVLLPMVENGQEALASMGDDTPLAVLSRRPRLLYSYFKQIFAQVTNPAIDPIREALVMSTNMYLGGRTALFEHLDGLGHDRDLIELDTPLLFDNELEHVRTDSALKDKVINIDCLFKVSDGPNALERKLKLIAETACKAVESDSATVVVISDIGVNRDNAAAPMLLAVGAVHQALVTAGVRLKCDIVAETAEARDVHQVACLLGFGANAVNPYLALSIIRDLILDGNGPEGMDVPTAYENYRKAIDKGLCKIMSKMGISTLFSYQGAQNFEALGIGSQVIRDCFFGTPSPIGGICYEQIAIETLRRHDIAFSEGVEVESEGYYKVKRRGEGEFHGWNPKVIVGMKKFIKGGGNYDSFADYKTSSDEHVPVAIKDLFSIRYSENVLDLETVEPMEDIRKRFTTAGMSYGALSPEAHETLAIAMNRIGGKSNSGEGGEDPKRFKPYENGDYANSAIKQVASGRFGVTAEYLACATEIEIKVAQGAKPGEGGQLPGHKVSPMIAKLRYSVPGVMLISPPPHHDIYSIEDLAQLIFDLKEINPRAKVCVKLVSCSGVGTVAAGVAKAYADVILISGHDGGTGASPISSIKNAGSDWAIGLAEAHQVLMMNDLRSRVTLRTDGGMKTGRDIVIAALLGAEEYNFGTAAMIAAGCAMFRVCHLNTCPVGVATQREDLRAKFPGKVENVVNYFNAVAEDVRRILAKLGYKSMDEIIGRTDLLEQIDDPGNPKSKLLNLSGLLHQPDPTGDSPRIHTRERNDRFGNEGSLDDQILQEARDSIARRTEEPFVGKYKIKNVHRDVGTHISGECAYQHGNQGLKPGTLDLTFTGSAGQSFGTFLVQGIRLKLIGDANDYVGKGMNGGEIVVRPNPAETYDWSKNTIVGNTCLYGATGGYLFAAGRAGERFGVRNSGGTAVVEGLGDHGCEYMTGGVIISLGLTGRNFGAGMSGGLAFVYDEDGLFEKRLNPEMVSLARPEDEEEVATLKRLIELHAQISESPRAKALLEDWDNTLARFWRVTPHTAENVPEPKLEKARAEAVVAGGPWLT